MKHLKKVGIAIGVLLAGFILFAIFLPEEKSGAPDESEIPRESKPAMHSWKEINDIHACVESDNVIIRNTTVSIVADTPRGIDTNSEEWKIWQINYWVANNISYVSDPKGYEYYAHASETLETKGGDCDDFAILLASMYESVGLDAAIAGIDTEGSGKADHLACLVYYSRDEDDFFDEEKRILQKLKKTSPTGEIHIRYIDAPTSSLSKYDSGMWIFIDIPMAEVKEFAGYITHEPYDIISIIDVGE